MALLPFTIKGQCQLLKNLPINFGSQIILSCTMNVEKIIMLRKRLNAVLSSATMKCKEVFKDITSI